MDVWSSSPAIAWLALTSRSPDVSSAAALLSHQAASLAFGRSHSPAARSVPLAVFEAAGTPAALTSLSLSDTVSIEQQ